MRFPSEYEYLENYLLNDSIWLEDTLSWSSAADLILADYSIISFLTAPFFTNSHIFLDSYSKMSFIDFLCFIESDVSKAPKELFHLLVMGALSDTYTKYLPAHLYFYTDYQDFQVLMLNNSPELLLALSDYFDTYFGKTAVNLLPSAVFDVFNDSMMSSFSQFIEYITMFMVFFWGVVILNGLCSLMRWNNPVEVYFVRFQYYIMWICRETRTTYEASLQIFFFAFFYFFFMIMTFDDDQEEFIEFFTNTLFTFFLFTFVYSTYKHSMHFFSFLEASISKGASVSFAIKQFARDMLNTFAFVLRFLVLMLRLNIYDLVDDCLDSYYIFIGDFDDDEYFYDLFFSLFSVMFFDTDNNDDRSFQLEGEVDLMGDLFVLFFVMWGQFGLFIFFFVEEVARVLLALYVTYLIIFEIHAVNGSYVEDTYLFHKRTNFKTTRTAVSVF